jgi:protein-disulfide isomerase
MLLLFLLTVALCRRGMAVRPAPAVFWGLALITTSALGVQAGLMQSAASKPPITAERLSQLTHGDLANDATSLGPSEAPVTIVIFADLWCSACRKTYSSLTKYQQANPTGVRLVFRHLPLWELRGHEGSRIAAALGEIAAEQGKFWQFADALHALPKPPDRAGYLQVMSSLGFEPHTVEARLENPQDLAIQRVLRDEALAAKLEVNATPTFIVLLHGERPFSANQRTLPRILNSEPVQRRIASGSSAHL